MKKRWKLLVVGVSAAVLATGCGNKDNNTNVSTTVQEESISTAESQESTEETTTEVETIQRKTASAGPLNYSEYITLGQYKGIETTAISVTDEDIEQRLGEMFRAVRLGDIVNISYQGLMDGVAFEGGTAENQRLEIGAGNYIDGFEDGLIGAEIGEMKTLNLTFPDPYTNNPDYSGKPVVFEVSINGIEGVVAPELTESYVTENTEYKTIDEYKNGIHDTLLEEKESMKMQDVWGKVLEQVTINNYPQDEVDSYAQELNSYYEQMASYYGMDKASLLTIYGMTEEQFLEECQKYGQDVMREYMALNEIARQENISLSDEEYQSEINNALDGFGGTEEELVAAYGGKDLIRENLLFNKVIEFVSAQAVEK